MASRSVSDPNQQSLAERLALNPTDRAAFLASLSEQEHKLLLYRWDFWGRPKQLSSTITKAVWVFWLVLAGRGFGKTRTGAQWVQEQVENHGKRRVALVAETAADARDVMVEGESGLLACAPPWFRPKYEPSKRRITWPNGAIATTYSADEPGQLRGPQHDAAWADELAKWRYDESWDQLCMGLRLGDTPQAIVTTTPRPTPIIKGLIKDPLCHVTTGTTYENRGNVAQLWLEQTLRKYEGTRLGRQELEAEILEDAPGALWKRDAIDSARVIKAPGIRRIVVAVDPSVSADARNAATGIVVVGLGSDNHGYVLADGSLQQPTPEAWGRAALALYHTLGADCVIGESNNGGDLVEANLRAIDKGVNFKSVRASRGKHVRAEPIASLYEQARVHHVGAFPLLEDELCQWEPDSKWSPNRLDALVWGLTELMLLSGPEQKMPPQPKGTGYGGSRWDGHGGKGF